MTPPVAHAPGARTSPVGDFGRQAPPRVLSSPPLLPERWTQGHRQGWATRRPALSRQDPRVLRGRSVPVRGARAQEAGGGRKEGERRGNPGPHCTLGSPGPGADFRRLPPPRLLPSGQGPVVGLPLAWLREEQLLEESHLV